MIIEHVSEGFSRKRKRMEKRFWFTVTSGNNKVLVTSETYTTKQSMRKGIRSLLSGSKVIKQLSVLIIIIMLSSCGSSQQGRYVCNCEQQEKLQAFVKESIKPANNMSDEEMEDVIAQLRYDGVRIFCSLKPVWVFRTSGAVDWKKQGTPSNCEFISDLF